MRVALIIFMLTWIFTLARGWAEETPKTPRHPVPPLFAGADKCMACHNGLAARSGLDVSIGSDWQASMMANASRDPYWHAAVRRETMDHPAAQAHIQNECAACHMPMARFQARAEGREGAVFAHIPILPTRSESDRLAADAVSCVMCHQIQKQKLGTEASFTAGFVVDDRKQPGLRPVFGPFTVDAGRKRVMSSASRFVPEQGRHVQDSALCGSCHTLYTNTLGPGGEVRGRFPEQVPYLEWRHSGYAEEKSCQSCHMPQLQELTPITSVLALPRDHFSRHVFRGGNFFMLNMLNQNAEKLAVAAPPEKLAHTATETVKHLQTAAARLSIEQVSLTDGRLEADVSLINLAGHKLPTAYPSRRVWIHLSVRDQDGRVVFESGAPRPDGSIAGNDNDRDGGLFEPHYIRIESAEQVQIYEAIMVDPNDRVTTGLLSAIRLVKDNRVLPSGFDKNTAPEDVAARGRAKADSDFRGGSDRIRYSVNLEGAQGPFSIKAELWYQPIAYRWARNLGQRQAPEIEKFTSLYNTHSKDSAVVLAGAVKTLK
ncbi:MAG: hypothetical protein JRJ60_15560 [Deltaproteobacteria bacterium]|nr:hypothetical protein [Deltaproteobacteria bacterium]